MTRLQQIGPEYRDAALRLSKTLPRRCTYIAGWVHDGGLEGSLAAPKGWLLAEMTQGREVVGLVYVSATGIVIPVLHSETAYEQIVALARMNPGMVRVLVGERRHIGGLWFQLKSLGLRARIVRDQMVYTVERGEMPASNGALALIAAGEPDLDDVVQASAAMAVEEAGDDPHARNPTLFKERIRARLARQRDFIYRVQGRVAFKSNVSALSPIGGQLEGIYTPPDLRRQGLGYRGTAAITAWILERAERSVLLVNDDNLAARALYEKLGYRACHESRTIFISP